MTKKEVKEKLKVKKLCKAINRNKTPCRFTASIDGYCIIHWQKNKKWRKKREHL